MTNQTLSLTSQITRRYVFIGITAFIGSFGLFSVLPKPDGSAAAQPGATIIGGGIHGSVTVKAPSRSTQPSFPNANFPEELLYLPDFEVFLVDSQGNTTSSPQKTDAYGRYYFPRQKPGVYELRWKEQNGWRAGSLDKRIVIRNNTVYPARVVVQPKEGLGVVTGRVAFLDGSTPYFTDARFKIDHTATVDALNLNTGRVAGSPVRANAVGDYAIAGLPRGNTYRVRVRSQAVMSTAAVLPTFISFAGVPARQPLKITLRNRRPRVDSASVSISGNVVRNLAPNALASAAVQARDADGDTLQARWSNSSASFTPASSLSSFTAPTSPGQYEAYVVVSDGKGGFARGYARFRVDQEEEVFAGRVISIVNGTPINGAAVDVNGVTVRTDVNGTYLVKARPAARFVVNVSSKGFAPGSRLFKSGATGQTWRLVPTQELTNLDPTRPIQVSSRPWRENQQTRPVQFSIPAGALVAAGNVAPRAPLTASTVVLNIANGETPGDWGGLENGREVNLISYGVAFIELKDAAGRLCNLAAGKKAQVTMTAPVPMRRTAPRQVPFWSYDDKDGYWKLSGAARFSAATGTYVGEVSHFSTINTDLSKTDASCLKIVRDASLPAGLTFRVTDPTGAIFTQAFEGELDDVNAVYRLIPNTNVKVEVLDTNHNPIGNVVLEDSSGTTLTGNIVNTGPPIPAGHSLWPDFPYDDCKAVTVKLVIPGGGVFLTFGGPSFAGVGTDPEALAYYKAVDPQNQRLTLGQWWQANGFDPNTGTAAGAIRTSYLNDNDLGSGRDMHFLSGSGGRIAAYVTNYGNFDQNPSNADLAATQTNPGATVCMEYAPIEGDSTNTMVVKFFVFFGNGNGKDAPRQTFADLDGNGPKYVPNLCLNCHGGSYFPADPLAPTLDEVNLQACFRELDYGTYKFPGARPTPNASEKSAFHQQNDLVKLTVPGPAIEQILTGWYSGGGDDQDANFTPPDWQISGSPQVAQLYLNVVAESCRTCHVAFRGDETTADGVVFSRYDQFAARAGTIEGYVCGASKFMPHAKITYNNFWKSVSPSRPATLKAFTGPGWTPFSGSCPQ